jgi:hypothetical protein
VDIKSFFDTIDHRQLRSFRDQRVRDGVSRRMIDKWLKARVLEEGVVHHPEEGTPQGGVISPLLANIYLHHVLDTWFEGMAKPVLRGEALAAPSNPKRGDDNEPGTFDLLGFTHYWKRSARKGVWVVARKTAKGRFTRAIRKVSEWCREHRHDPVIEQHRGLVAKLRGHYQYFGITGNGRALLGFYESVRRLWRRWLNRRSQRNTMTWERFAMLQQHCVLPRPVIATRSIDPQRIRDLRSRMR